MFAFSFTLVLVFFFQKNLFSLVFANVNSLPHCVCAPHQHSGIALSLFFFKKETANPTFPHLKHKDKEPPGRSSKKWKGTTPFSSPTFGLRSTTERIFEGIKNATQCGRGTVSVRVTLLCCDDALRFIPTVIM